MCKLHSDGTFDTCNEYDIIIKMMLVHAISCKSVQSSDDILGEAVKDLMKNMEIIPPSLRDTIKDIINDKWHGK